MKEIPLTKGYVAIVDDEDYERVAQFNWFAYARYAPYGRVYAKRHIHYPDDNNRLKGVMMHRFLMGDPLSEVDHIDGNCLNNRRSNLRCASRAENARNRHRIMSASGYKGVFAAGRGNKWRAAIMHNYKYIHLGHFESRIAAARAYNAKALELFGEFARLNELPQEAA